MISYSHSGGHNGTGSFNYSDDDHDYGVYHNTTNNAGVYNRNAFTEYPYYPDYNKWFVSYQYILGAFAVLICCFGMWGNGMVIWLLGFRIERNNFTTCVLNLAVADFGFLVSSIVGIIIYILSELSPGDDPDLILFPMFLLFLLLYFSMFCSSQFFLTAISVDRCVSVFYPLWHRCHRPAKLSAIVCALIWLLSFLPYAIMLILYLAGVSITIDVVIYHLIVNCSFCVPLMIISSLLLLIKVCCESKQQRKEKLLKTILLTVFFFLFLCFPFNAFSMICHFNNWDFIFLQFAMFSACLNSSVNPFIYYLIGRPKKGHSNKNMKAILQKLFKE